MHLSRDRQQRHKTGTAGGVQCTRIGIMYMIYHSCHSIGHFWGETGVNGCRNCRQGFMTYHPIIENIKDRYIQLQNTNFIQTGIQVEISAFLLLPFIVGKLGCDHKGGTKPFALKETGCWTSKYAT
jgi:hypothetical protein